jgi:hypothetical protein
MKMKTLKLAVIGILLFFAGSVQAQISGHLDLGTPPQWGPAGYSNVRYYYMPDVEAYYDVPSSMFIYFNGVSWVRRSSLPSRYRNYDLYNGYKVLLSDYRGNRPYSNFRMHRREYGKGYHGPEQHSIGQRPDKRNDNRDRFSPKPGKVKNQKNGHGNSKNRGNGPNSGNEHKN